MEPAYPEWGMRLAVVTGGNRGIGYATVRRLCCEFDGRILLAGRSRSKGAKALARLKEHGCRPTFSQLDLADQRSRDAFANHVRVAYGGLDVLVNNAGIRFGNGSTVPFYQQVSQTLSTNFYGTVFLCQALFPLLRPQARVVNVVSQSAFLSGLQSSRLKHRFARPDNTFAHLFRLMHGYKQAALAGRHEALGWGASSFLVSQLGLVAATMISQRAFDYHPWAGRLVNAYSPGDCATSMTNFTGQIRPFEAAMNIVRLAMLPANTTRPAGQYVWHDMTVLDWRGAKPTSSP